MWTPKRILLLSVGFLGFTLVYLVYSMTTLGRINTLPPLPERYRINPSTFVEVRPPETTPSPLVLKLERAFGKECKEKKWPVQLELNSKSIVMAAEDYKFETDGRMLLESMSIALFGKKKNNSQEVEINTLRCRRAYITFDQPVTSLATKELSGRKIVEAKLHGEGNSPIIIENNRRTSRLDDDLRVTINHGPLYYHEGKQLIWTNDLVKVRDGDPLPKADIVAEGMVMELATAAPPPKPGAPIASKPKTENISGVKRIVLKQNVTMHLFVSGGTPFPGGAKDSPAPATENKNAVAATAAKPPEPSHIIIRTPGRFQYDFFKDYDLARFDVPDDADHIGSPQDVTVERVTKKPEGRDKQEGGDKQEGRDKQEGIVQLDQLVCKHLEMRLKRRSGEAKPGKTAEKPAQSPEQELEIEWAHATGPNVTLTSDAEKLDAHGTDFFHDAAKKLTILKGAPFMEANKEDSLIQAPELRIQEVPLPPSPKGKKGEDGQPNTYQQIHASGPGQVHMLNKTTNKRTTHAYWNKELISTREGELDLLILTGEARFVEDGADDEHKQWLKADTLKVWLLAEDKKLVASAKTTETKEATAKKTAAPEQSRRPHRILAERNIVSHSPQLNIPAAGRLLVRFTDVPAERMPPERTPASAAKTGARPQQPPVVGAVSGTTPTSPTTPTQASRGGQPPDTSSNPRTDAPGSPKDASKKPGAGAPRLAKPEQAAPPPTEPPPPPIEMTARSIEAEVLRCGERVVLDHLWAEGSPIDDGDKGVEVRQEPAKKGERGVYIKGNSLDMRCYPDGNVLNVSGDLAQLMMDKIHIVGPDVHIDQTSNQASVNGEGAMRMESNQTLDGKQLKQPEPLIVHWSELMVFSGDHAEFDGGIQATQKNARLACQHLQVLFDRPISLKEGARGDQPAKVRKLVGDKDVRVEDKVVDERGKLQKYQLLSGISINMETVPRDDEDRSSAPPAGTGNGKEGSKSNDANEVTLSGPGSVRLMQYGGSDLTTTPSRPAPNQRTAAKQAPGEQTMKTTYIRFEKLMKASNRTNTASFWGHVEVLNFPCEDKDEHREIDLDTMLARLPVGGMHLRCESLKVRSYQKKERNPREPNKVIEKSYQEMEAHGRVTAQGKEFFAQSAHMTFNEEKDQVIFIGEKGRPAVLQRSFVKGAEPDVIRGRKIFYIRSTGQAWADDIDGIDVK